MVHILTYHTKPLVVKDQAIRMFHYPNGYRQSGFETEVFIQLSNGKFCKVCSWGIHKGDEKIEPWEEPMFYNLDDLLEHHEAQILPNPTIINVKTDIAWIGEACTCDSLSAYDLWNLLMNDRWRIFEEVYLSLPIMTIEYAAMMKVYLLKNFEAVICDIICGMLNFKDLPDEDLELWSLPNGLSGTINPKAKILELTRMLEKKRSTSTRNDVKRIRK